MVPLLNAWDISALQEEFSLRSKLISIKNPETYDLIITDMTMPLMTGKELAGELKKTRSDIPIIICTGFSDQIDEKEAKEIGINAFVMKPIVRNKMAKTICDVLGRK